MHLLHNPTSTDHAIRTNKTSILMSYELLGQPCLSEMYPRIPQQREVGFRAASAFLGPWHKCDISFQKLAVLTSSCTQCLGCPV